MVEQKRELPRLVMFDLDGTLVDTVPDIAAALNGSLVALGEPPVSDAEVRHWVGNGARALCGRALSRSLEDTADPVLADALNERFLQRYLEGACEASRVYPGVRDALAWLGARDVALACVTNKPMQHTRILLDTLDLDRCFRLVLGGDSLARKKPDPLPLLECLRHFKMGPHHAVLVGDSVNDVEAARAAGIESICVTYGYNHGRDVSELGADRLLDTLADLPLHFTERPGCVESALLNGTDGAE